MKRSQAQLILRPINYQGIDKIAIKTKLAYTKKISWQQCGTKINFGFKFNKYWSLIVLKCIGKDPYEI